MKVSVFMITYNHEAYIAQAIDSIVGQQVNFDFELVIGEDFSKDKTYAICKQYAEKYPTIIRLLPSDRNYGPMGNTVRTLNECNGQYIALCEGDDYWIDNNKLQKQVDFLDAHPDFTMCFSGTQIVDEMGLNKLDEHHFPKVEKDVLSIEDFILSEMSVVPTATMLFRNVLPRPLPDFFVHAMVGDMGIQLMVADKGLVKYMPEQTAIYRVHPGGMTKVKENIERADKALMKLYREFNEHTGYKYNTAFRKRFFENSRMNLIYGSRELKGAAKRKHVSKYFKQYFKNAERIDIKEVAYYTAILFFPSILKLKAKK